MERTITFFYPDENKAASLKIFQERTNQIKGFYFTKDNIKIVEGQESASNYAIYFLFDDSDPDEANVYIGQSMNGIKRIHSHIREKDFWSYCILFVTDNNSFDKLAIDYLEYKFIDKFKKSSYIISNKDLRNNEPNISMYDRPVLDAHIRQIEFLLSAEGIIIDLNDVGNNEDYYYPKNKNYKAKLHVKNGKFILKKGSCIKRPIDSSKNWKSDRFYKKNNRIIDSYLKDEKIKEDGDSFILTVDIAYNSPSAPGSLITGRNTNGWKFFKDLNDLRENEL